MRDAARGRKPVFGDKERQLRRRAKLVEVRPVVVVQAVCGDVFGVFALEAHIFGIIRIHVHRGEQPRAKALARDNVIRVERDGVALLLERLGAVGDRIERLPA